MNDKLQKAFENLVPFIVLGVAIALVLGLLFMFSYVIIWGVIIGAILWLIALGKQFLFPAKQTKNSSGRIIEHEDKK